MRLLVRQFLTRQTSARVSTLSILRRLKYWSTWENSLLGAFWNLVLHGHQVECATICNVWAMALFSWCKIVLESYILSWDLNRTAQTQFLTTESTVSREVGTHAFRFKKENSRKNQSWRKSQGIRWDARWRAKPALNMWRSNARSKLHGLERSQRLVDICQWHCFAGNVCGTFQKTHHAVLYQMCWVQIHLVFTLR